MKAEYIYLLTGISSGFLKIHDAEYKDLKANGYLDEKNNLTDKAKNLVAALEACSEVYEESYEFKKEASQVVNDMKETFAGMFNSFRNNASGMLQNMADSIKVKK